MIPLSLAATKMLSPKPELATSSGVELYSLPGWSLRKVGADAMIVFADETGFLGHKQTKYVKDKGDFGLDDTIRKSGSLRPGECRSFKVRRLPVDYLIVANIYDERKVATQSHLNETLSRAASMAQDLGCQSAVLFDPTDSWNYYAHRVEPEDSAEMLKCAIEETHGKLATIRLVVTNSDHLPAYKRVFI